MTMLERARELDRQLARLQRFGDLQSGKLNGRQFKAIQLAFGLVRAILNEHGEKPVK